MGDIIIFLKTIEQHYKDLIVIIKKYFTLEKHFLGDVVSHNVIKSDHEKFLQL